jgi:hypothetical protein
VTLDVVALCARPPDAGTVLAALAASAPDLGVGVVEPVVQLVDGAGTVLVSVEGPRAAGLLSVTGGTSWSSR